MFSKIKAGTTSLMLPIFVRDSSSSTGAGLSLAYNASGLVGEYRRIGASTWTTITLATATLGTYTSGGWVADGSDTGSYEVGIPNAAVASGAKGVIIRFRGAANMVPVRIYIELDAVDYQDSGRMGLTALPAAAADGAGGLPVIGTNNNQFSSTLGKVTIANNAINNNTFAAGAITAATFAANALGAVWDEATSSHVTAGTYGVSAASDTAGTTTLLSRLSATRAGYLDNLSAGAVATASALTTVGGNVTTILGQTGTTGVVIADGAITAAKIASDAITAAKIATGAITAAKFAAGAIDAAAIATGAIDADALATDAVTEIWSMAVPGAYASGTAAYVLGNIATGTPPTAAAIADAVWDEARTGHTTSGTFGYYLDSAISAISGGGGPSAATIADAVWDELISGHATTGSFGAAVTTDQASLSTLLSRLSSTRAGNLDYLDAAITSTASGSALSSVASNVTTILGQTGTTGVVVAAGSKSGYALSSSGLDAVVVETGVNARQALSVIAAAGGGVLAGAGTGTITIKGANVATTRITATTDSSGNRSSITLSLPS